MAKVNKVTQSFNAGELSPLMDSRIDQEKYASGCRTMENFYPLIYGGASLCPGTEYIARQKDKTAKARMIEFEHSVDDTYMLCFENQVIRFFKSGDRVYESAQDIDGVTIGSDLITINGHGYSDGDWVKIESITGSLGDILNNKEFVIDNSATNTFTLTDLDGNAVDFDGYAYTLGGTVKKVYEKETPYLTADLFELKVHQSADVMFISHPDYEPRRLSRTGDTSWTLAIEGLSKGPFRTQNTDTSKTIAVAEISGGGILAGASVTLTATGHSPFNASHVPDGATDTSTSQTGALFRFKYSATKASITTTELASQTLNAASDTLYVPKGSSIDFSTNGTWGATGDPATVVLEKSYDSGSNYFVIASKK